jgi:hypothetical protein
VCLGGAWGVQALQERFGKLWLTLTAAGAVALQIAATELPEYAVPGPQWAEVKVRWLYPQPLQYGDIFTKTRELALRIKVILKPDETLYHWGQETGLHYYSQRRPPTGVLTHWGLVGNPLAPKYSAWVLRDLQRAPPELFVLNPIYGNLGVRHPVLQYFRQNYVPYPTQPAKYFLVYMRRGGRVANSPNPPVIGEPIPRRLQ